MSLLLGAALAAALLLTATPALASRAHVFSHTFGGPGSGPGQFIDPSGVAVNEATGDVYVADKGNNRVEYFDSTGTKFEGEFTGPTATGSGTVTSGSSTIEGVTRATGAFSVGEEVSAVGLAPGTTIVKVGEGTLELSTAATAPGSEAPEPLSANQPFSSPEGIAVDNSCRLRGLTGAACEASDPSNGDVYVVDAGHAVLDKFNAKGEYLGQLTEAKGVPFLELDGVAVEPQGMVSIIQKEEPGLASGVIDRFNNELANKFSARVPTGGQLNLPGFTGFVLPGPGLAVDSEGAFYERHTVSGLPRVSKLDALGNLLIGEVDSEESSAVAVEQTSDAVLIDNLTSIGVFDPEGALLERLGEEGGTKHLLEGAGIGVNAAASIVYVADAAPTSDVVDVFLGAPPQQPDVKQPSIADVSGDSATLTVQINPRSEPGEPATTYRVQYGPCASPSTCSSSAYGEEAPQPPGFLAPDFEAHEVTIHLQGLTPGTTYHFRVLAQNTHGSGQSAEQVFSTQGVGGELVLPDGRQWELVSPPDKLGANIEPIAETGVIQAAATGGAISYLANAPTEAEPQGDIGEVQVLSTRGSGGWSSRDLTLPHSAATGLGFGVGVSEYRLFSEDLSDALVQPFGELVPQISPEASEQTAFLESLSASCGSSCFRPLVTAAPGHEDVSAETHFGETGKCEKSHIGVHDPVICGPTAIDATGDLSHVILRSQVPLKEGAGNNELYEWANGGLVPVSVMPDGSPAPEGEATLGLNEENVRGALSNDGSMVVWALSSGGGLFLRDVPKGETLKLDLAEGKCLTKAQCVSGGGEFQIASVDDSRVLFTDAHRLTEDAGVAGKSDLYECAIVEVAGKLACSLSDLTPETGGESASVLGGVLGAGEDGSSLYFVAEGALTSDPNARGEHATPGQPNLYARRSGVTVFIATLSATDAHDWARQLQQQPTRVSPDGRWLAFMSERSLTGYDNRDVTTGKPVAEVYLYSASTGRLVCASCTPTGARPVGVEDRKLEQGNGGLVGGDGIWQPTALVAANVPGWTQYEHPPSRARHQPRFLSDTGRLFFNTDDALVSQDVNATQDVYQYEPAGVPAGEHACTSVSATFSERSGGCVSLISSGSSGQESAFLDASASGGSDAQGAEGGGDVFFLTAAKLTGQDTDAAFDVYDAHECTGGSPCIATSAAQPPPCTTGDACKPAPSPQPDIFGAPASATFSGPGNAAPQPVSKPAVSTPCSSSKGAPAKACTRAQNLKKAIATCKRKYPHSKRKRRSCEASAHKRYGAKKGEKSAHKSTAASASTLTLNDSGHLHLSSHHGFTLNEQGTASGTITGTIYIHLNVISTNRVTAEINIYPSGGSLTGSAIASYHPSGSVATFSGTMSVLRGTGRFSHARGSGLSFTGSIQRSNDAVTVRVSGRMST